MQLAQFSVFSYFSSLTTQLHSISFPRSLMFHVLFPWICLFIFLLFFSFVLVCVCLFPFSGVDPSGPISSQVMTAVRSACRKAYSLRAPRLLEAMFRVDLQCHTDALGGLFAVLAKRRGKVISEEMREGTNIFNVSAYLPVAESFGFAGDMRKKTGGEASPQLIFSHWELITQDPVWTPTTEEEIEYYGTQDATPNLAKELMDSVRRRKGLAVQEKVVVHAEKQRTLKH